MITRISKDCLMTVALQPESAEEEIGQNLTALALTPRGSVPLMRDMGMDMRYIDLPAELAANLFESELVMTADEYEERAEITAVTFRTEDGGQTLIPIVEVEIVDE